MKTCDQPPCALDSPVLLIFLSTCIRHQNGVFRKRSLNRMNLKTTAFRVRVEGKHSENGAFG